MLLLPADIGRRFRLLAMLSYGRIGIFEQAGNTRSVRPGCRHVTIQRLLRAGRILALFLTLLLFGLELAVKISRMIRAVLGRRFKLCNARFKRFSFGFLMLGLRGLVLPGLL